jgi:4-amino-4-deoxy-L-arabinose transferase-like glycosyltransferase
VLTLTEEVANEQIDVGYRGRVSPPPVVKKADLAWFALIIGFGAAAVFLHQRTVDFMGEDAFYADAARSLLHHGFYGVNGLPETTQPPGLAGILAALFALFGYGYAVSIGAVAFFETLGFLAAYELLRRRAPRLVAGTICILLLSSPVYFAWATRLVYACFPYFFTTMLALLSGWEYDKAATKRSRIGWGLVFAAAVAASLLIATGTIALLGAMISVIAATVLKDWRVARTRLLKFLPVLLLGIAVQAVWMHRKPAPLEWSLPGYPASYLNQLKVKNGNNPELGMATWSDIPGRVTTNLLAESDILAQLVLRHGVNQSKVAVVIIPVLFIAFGWGYSVWKAGGAELVEWYFAGYQAIYLLWPWTMDVRFLLPIAPLACFYIWQGIKAAILAVKTKPRLVGIISFPAAVLLTISGGQWIAAHRTTGFGDWPDELLIPMWLVWALCALWMAYSGRSIFSVQAFSGGRKWLGHPLDTRRVRPLRLAQYAGYAFVMSLVVVGVAIEVRVARENLNTTSAENNAENTGTIGILPSDVEAGIWLRAHTPPDSVIMARHWPTVYHYADRRLVWFPPISDPDVLLDGIVKNGVGYVVVVNRSQSYYLPDDDYCFDRLFDRYGADFQLVLQESNFRIFKFERNVTPRTSRRTS